MTTQEKTEKDWTKVTLETCGEDVKLHSKRVEKMLNRTRNGWRTHGSIILGLSIKCCQNTLLTVKLKSKTVT